MPIDRTTKPISEALLLTAPQVAELTQLGVRTIWRHVSTGEFPAPISIGRSKRWHRKAIEAWAETKAAAARK